MGYVLDVHAGDDGLGGLLRFERFPFVTDVFELTRIEPKTGTAWAFVDDNLPLFAVKMAHQNDLRTFGAMPAGLEVDLNGRIAPDIDLDVPRVFLGRLDFLQFKRIEPDAAASPVADVKNDTTRDELSKIISACRAFHTM